MQDYLAQQGIDPNSANGRSLMQLGSAALGAAAGGGSGAAMGLAGERYNRELHPEEIAKLNALKQGKTPEQQQRLADAACALTHCSAGIADSDPNKALLVASEQRGAGYASEQQALQGTGLYTYDHWDNLKDWSLRNELGTRTLGGLQWVGGTAQAIGSAASACATGAGCLAAGYLLASGYDNAQAGFQSLVNGSTTPTLGAQVLQGLGMSPGTAELVYGATQIGTLASQGIVVAKGINTELSLQQLARATYSDFSTQGINPTPEVMATPEVQAMMKEISKGDPSLDAGFVEDVASGYVRSGAILPVQGEALPGTTLIKVVPKGSGVSKISGYWMTPKQADALSGMSPEKIAKTLGLPAEQAYKMAQNGVDFYYITPKPGEMPTIFMSKIANTSQGNLATLPTANQVIVLNRDVWTNPKKVNPTKFQK